MNMNKGLFFSYESELNLKKKQFLLENGWNECEPLIWEKDGDKYLFLEAYRLCKNLINVESKIKPPRFWEEPAYIPANLPSKFSGYYQNNLIKDSKELVKLAETDPICIFDIECYKNYFCIGYKFPSVDKYLLLEHYEGKKLNVPLIKWIANKFVHVGFNSSKYDNLMLSAACQIKLDEFSNARLKAMSNAHILGDVKDSDIANQFNFIIQDSVKHIDLMQIAPQSGSLKIYSGRASAKCIMDLPIESEAILTDKQMFITGMYCFNDLDATDQLAKKLSKQIKLRMDMGKKFKLNLLCSSDAGIAKKVICNAVKKATGRWPKPPEVNPFTFTFKYDPPSYIAFKSDTMRNVFRSILSSNFGISHARKVMLPEVIENEVIEIGNTRYNLGIGGLHSMEKSCTQKADEDYDLEDWDVESYYPRIIINNNYYPNHIGQSFQPIYRGIVKSRINAKTNEKEILKELDVLKAEAKKRNLIDIDT